MSELIQSDNPFSSEQVNLLRAIAEMIIPASEKHAVPGADDELIFPVIINHLSHTPAPIVALLDTLDPEAFFTFTVAQRQQEVESRADAMCVRILSSAVTQAYYQDARILESIGHEGRAPFPQGHELEQGDWSLLDPVKARGKIYRKV